jgi:hypothetical protein
VANFGTHALQRISGGVADLSLDHVDVFPASVASEQGAGTLTTTSLLDADPAFAADGFTPTAGSPLIDAGTPGPLEAGESPTDLAGNPRIVAFGCGDAIRDLGAIEAVGHCDPAPAPAPAAGGAIGPGPDTVAPLVTKLRIGHRRIVRFTLSEAAKVTLRVTRPHRRALVVQRSVGAGSRSIRLRHALPRGRFTIKLLAVDAAGNRSAAAILRR